MLEHRTRESRAIIQALELGYEIMGRSRSQKYFGSVTQAGEW